VHRRVDVAEIPLVGRQLPVWMKVIVTQHQVQLRLGEFGVDNGERQHVKGQVPGGVPRVLPLVRHGDDVIVEHVKPLAVAHLLAQRRSNVVLLQPLVHIVVEVLLGPEHAGQGLAKNIAAIRVSLDRRRNQRRIEGVRCFNPGAEQLVETGKRIAAGAGGGARQPQANRLFFTGSDRQLAVGGSLGAGLPGIDGIMPLVDEKAVETVLDIGAAVRCAGDALMIGFILGKEQRHVPFTAEIVIVEEFLEQGVGMVSMNNAVAIAVNPGQHRFRAAAGP